MVVEVLFDIILIDHELIPPHIKLTSDGKELSTEDKEAFYNTYYSIPSNIPKMFVTDPVARYYNYKIDDIIKIIRPSETSSESISYRRVIKADLL